MLDCLVEVLMMEGKGRNEDSLVSETMKDMLRVVKYWGDKLF